MSRVEEIFTLVKEQIDSLTNKPIDYILLTGGTSNLPQIRLVASEILGDVTLGNIKVIGVRNNKYSSALGNVLFFVNRLKLRGKNYSMVTDEEAKIVASSDKANSNETMLGKVFGYFFGE